MRSKLIPYFLVLPMLVTVIGLSIYPSIYCFYMSTFSTSESLAHPVFVGFGNFLDLFTSGTFWNSMKVTFIFMGGSVFLEFALGLVLALLLKRITIGYVVYRSIFVLPLAVTPTISALTWRIMYNPSFGVINGLTAYLHLPALSWHTSPSLALLSVIIVDVWQWTPFMMLILLAGLRMIPKEYYEASALDGASSWKTFLYVTLPMLKPVVLIVLIFRALDAFRTFDIIFVLTKGGPGRATETLVINTFIEAFYNYSLGKAAAISILMLVIWIFLCKVVMRQVA